MAHAFETLTPDVVLDALEGVGLRGDGRLTALSSYENRVYQVQLEDGSAVVAKFYRPERWSDAQILEEHAFAAELMAFEVPAIGPLVLGGQTLHHFGGFAFSVSPRRGGRAPELDDGEVLEWIGRFLARIHTVGARQDFVHRPTLDLENFAIEPMQWLLAHDMVPLDVQSAWTRGVEAAIAAMSKYSTLSAAPKGQASGTPGIRLLRLHGDCHPGNLLWREGQIQFVDFDDCATGPALQDLWMLLSGDRESMRRQLSDLLEGYSVFRAFEPRELVLIEALRSLRLLHYHAWIARRWTDPAFPAAFPWFEERAHWDRLLNQLREQLDLLEGPPLRL